MTRLTRLLLLLLLLIGIAPIVYSLVWFTKFTLKPDLWKGE